MPPREEDKEDLSQDVGGGDVEVVFQSWDGDVSVYLGSRIRTNSPGSWEIETDTLLHILLTGHHGLLSDLEAHLGGLIVHEAAERRRELTSSARLMCWPPHLSVRTPIVRASL